MAKKSVYRGNQLLTELKQGNAPRPVYYVYGEDPYMHQEIATALKALIQPAFKDFNLHQVTAAETSGDQIVSLAQQLPVMDERCLVIVREAQQLKKDSWEQLLSYLSDPSPTTCLAFFAPGRNVAFDKRTKAGKLLGKTVVACAKPFDNQIPKWVQDRAKRHQLKLDYDASHRLIELLGTDLSSLNNALERISLYLGKKGQVNQALVDEVIAENRVYNVFDLTEQIGGRNLQQALKLLRGLMHTGEHPLKLLGLIARTFRDLLKVRIDIDRGATLDELDKYISPKLRYKRREKVQQLANQARKFNGLELQKALFLMQSTDISLKSSSGLSQELLMERLVLELCQLRIQP